jgi:predicted SprT family Zn-dependent metalloprotease
MTDPARRNEDEYFLRESAEQIARLRHELDAKRADQERAQHHMRCPRCGGHMAERRHHGVTIDECRDCGGVFLDKGELDILQHLDRGGPELGRFFGGLLNLGTRR